MKITLFFLIVKLGSCIAAVVPAGQNQGQGKIPAAYMPENTNKAAAMAEADKFKVLGIQAGADVSGDLMLEIFLKLVNNILDNQEHDLAAEVDRKLYRKAAYMPENTNKAATMAEAAGKFKEICLLPGADVSGEVMIDVFLKLLSDLLVKKNRDLTAEVDGKAPILENIGQSIEELPKFILSLSLRYTIQPDGAALVSLDGDQKQSGGLLKERTSPLLSAVTSIVRPKAAATVESNVGS